MDSLIDIKESMPCPCYCHRRG